MTNTKLSEIDKLLEKHKELIVECSNAHNKWNQLDTKRLNLEVNIRNAVRGSVLANIPGLKMELDE